MNVKVSGQKKLLLIIDVVLIAFLVQARSIPSESRTYPLIFIIGSLILSVLLMFKGKEKEETGYDASSIVILIFTVLSFLYLFFMTRIGYVLSTLIYLYLAEYIMRFDHKKPVFWIFPFALTVLMYFIFTYGLEVILPRGSWF